MVGFSLVTGGQVFEVYEPRKGRITNTRGYNGGKDAPGALARVWPAREERISRAWWRQRKRVHEPDNLLDIRYKVRWGDGEGGWVWDMPPRGWWLRAQSLSRKRKTQKSLAREVILSSPL